MLIGGVMLTDIVEMASSRPVSMIISSNGVSDETSINGSKSILSNKESLSLRSSNQQNIPINNIINANSSSSSIDSAGAKNVISIEKQMSSQVNSNATISSTTTDSELDSEQEERYIDNNNLLESNNVSLQIQQQSLSRRDSDQQKNDTNSQEQLSRRVKHFYKLFKSEIPDDMPELIDSYVCAYQGDILLQGKMYITDRYLCFHSRIISYITKHVYRWEQIANITKERVAFIFPTAIGIQLKHSGKKIIYASFLQRDQAFDKIIYMCSRFNNDTNSLQDDDDNRSTQGGTLKALNSNHSYNEKIKKTKHDISYDMIDEPEPDEVLQMCLSPNNNNNNNKQRQQFILSKNFDIKQQLKPTKKLFNSDKNKSFKYSNTNPQLRKNFNENISDNNEFNRNSSSHNNNNNNQGKEIDTILSSAPIIFRQPRSIPLRTNRSRSRDRTLSPSNRTSSNIQSSNSSTSSITNTDSLIINSNNNGLIGKYIRIIILSIISIIKLIMEYLLLLFNRFKTYPIKTSLILLIFIIILIIHSFYLINVAYRIENRLQSLYPLWPSSSIKNSRRLQNEI
ncbi:unnamed protein product [Rotaria sordida]|uniref:GRAM domain-containing protein n=1 Tax=Rotaria sordida TaxID=392033 RepID=A0A813WA84_9BILA|nr:unnamed protein product [Rotaria sordida]